MMRRSIEAAGVAVAWVVVALAAGAGQARGEGENVAVFNFQMTSDTPEWVWLEKFMADQVATDLVGAGQINTIARDRMQEVADRIGWSAGRSLGDAAGLGAARKELKIEYVVSGVCGVKEGQVEITLQIVMVQGAREVFRKTVTGASGELVGLQKQASAAAIGWFQKRPEAQVLPALRVWTRSVPALKALYEGMNLYDQGRYAEAWLRFRQASRADKAYLEADYWVGRMYYFMDRYEHARRSLESFVYAGPVHPRVGAAVLEYLHTYEARGASPADLLVCYDRLRAKYPNVRVRPLAGDEENVDLDTWLRRKGAMLAAQTGQFERSVRLIGPAFAFHDVESFHSLLSATAHHTITGAPLPEALLARQDMAGKPVLIYVEPKGTREFTAHFRQSVPILGEARNAEGSSVMGDWKSSHVQWVFAPAGYSLKSLRFFPVVEGDESVFEVSVLGTPAGPWRQWLPELTWTKSAPVPQARKEGLRWTGAGPRSWARVEWEVAVKDRVNGPVVRVGGMRMLVELERVESWGTIDVSCRNTSAFLADLDGKPASAGPGLIGPVSPGKHRLTVRPATAPSPFLSQTLDVTVSAGKSSRVVARLPWKQASPWGAWADCLVEPFAPAFDFGEFTGPHNVRTHRPPSLLADGQALRLLWARHGDLWSTLSTDGRTFAPPRRLALPVSTGWIEEEPLCIRDEAGRYVLLFISDRNARHARKPYLAWSRDFEHWSAPVLLDPGGYYKPGCLDLLQDAGGRYLLVSKPNVGEIALTASTDLQHWQPLARISSGLPTNWDNSLGLTQQADGSYDLVVLKHSPAKGTALVAFHSPDAVAWDAPTQLECWPSATGAYASSCFQAAGKTHVLVTHFSLDADAKSTSYVLARKAGGAWQRLVPAAQLVYGPAAAAFHPRWGFLLAWLSPWMPTVRQPDLATGPFLYRTRAVEALGPGVSVAAVPYVDPDRPAPRVPEGPRAVGDLRYYAIEDSSSPMATTTFERPAAGSGLVSPKAFVATVSDGPKRYRIGMDWTGPKDSAHPTVAKIDLQGKGNFAGAFVAPVSMRGQMPDELITYYKVRADVPSGSRKIPMELHVTYSTGGSPPRRLGMAAGFAAEALCRFGDKDRRVCLVNADHNLQLGDPWKPAPAGVRARPSGDLLYVEGRFRALNLLEPRDDHGPIARYGQPILIDGKLFDVRISPDGARVAATPFAGPAGTLDVGQPRWRIVLKNEARLLTLDGEGPQIPVPAGEYRVESWCQQGPMYENPPRPARAEHLRPSGLTVKIAEGKTASLRIGTPLVGQMTVDREGNALKVRLAWRDQAGIPTGVTGPQPPVIVKDSAGAVVGTIANIHRHEWKIPDGFPGPVTLTVEGGGSFDVKVPPVKFDLK